MKRMVQRRLLPLLVAVACISLLATSAPAALLIYEPFDYMDGAAIAGQVNPNGQTWNAAGTAGPGTSVHSVLSPGLTSPPGFVPATGNKADMVNADTGQFDRMIFPGSQTFGVNTTLYYSLLFNVPDIAGLNTPNSNANANNDMIIAFNNGVGTGRPTNWAGELVIRLGSTTDKYQLGIRATNTTANTTYWSGDLNPGDTHQIVVRYVQGPTDSSGTDDSNDIWIDPSPATIGLPEGSVPAPDGSSNGTINAGSPANNYAAALIIGAGISNTATVQNPDHTYLDEIRVGTTWADVVVPEPSAAALLLIGCGLLNWPRRRKA
jgi:hypothetical protein